MPNNSILPNNQYIRKFFKEHYFPLYYSKPVLKHLEEFLIAATAQGFSAKTVDISQYSTNHRTTIGHFLTEGIWDESYIQQVIKAESLQFAFSQSRKTNEPLFIIHDDTVCTKTKPSSQAQSPIEQAAFHHSHLLGKTVWGHQLQATMIRWGHHTLIYDLHRYDKQKQSKIDDVCSIANSLPVPPNRAYALFDTWYTCPKIIDAYSEKGYHCIGGLKTNRIIYPKGIRISIKDFSQYIRMTVVRLVTVNGSKYWTYRYEGALNDIANAVVIFSWPEKAFHVERARKVFLCTDISLKAETLLEYYSIRWPNEIFFRQEKMNLGLDKYQIRSIKGIERLWTLQALVHLFCTIGLNKPMKFGEGMLEIRTQTKKEYISWIYECAQSGVALDSIFKVLKVS
jgi:hypothetical protein